MRLPIPFLLYVTALGLFGWAGWTVYQMLPQWKVETRNASHEQGRSEGLKLVAQGKASGPISADWRYDRDTWWPQLKQVNLIGKLPPAPVDAAAEAAREVPQAPVVDMTPLEDIFELVSLVYDSGKDGKGPQSHVIIRFKPQVSVEPPEWWVRENTPPTPLAFAGSGDRVIPNQPPPRIRPTARVGGRPTSPPGAAPMPTGVSSLTGREILQKLWLVGGEDGRRTATLWPSFAHIRLVRVDESAQSAFFVRDVPSPADGSTPPEPKEEELLKTTAGLSQDVLIALRRLQGGQAPREVVAGGAPDSSDMAWREVEETTRYGNQFHIGRKDELRFRQSSEDFFNNVYVDTYTSKFSNTRGLQVRQLDSKVAQSFGITQGDVLLEINGRKVESKAQATNQAKKDYDRGVRTFSTKWLSNGQVVDRVYQAPDR